MYTIIWAAVWAVHCWSVVAGLIDILGISAQLASLPLFIMSWWCRYTLQKKLTGQREAIYECNIFCACHAHGCANRVIGKGLGQRLQVGGHPHSHHIWIVKNGMK
jgi:hypothetical protein